MLLIGPALCLVQVLTVDDDGPADFADIPDAVAVAVAGDTILVEAGEYSSFTLSEGVRIIGEGRDDVRVTTTGGPLAVSAIPAGQEAFLGGLTVVPNGGPAVAMTVTGSSGSVVLHDLAVGELTGPAANLRGGLLVIGSDHVQLHHCELYGGGDPQAVGGFQGNPALDADISNVAVSHSVIVGGHGSAADASNGQSAIRLVAARLDLVRTSVTGGSSVPTADRAGDAIFASAGSEIHAWGDTGEIRGGSISGASAESSATGGFGMILEASSAVAHPDVPVTGGLGGTLPQVEEDPVLLAFGSTFEGLDSRPPTLEATPLHVEVGGSLDLAMTGEDDALVGVLWSAALGTPLVLPGVFGQLHLDAADLNVLAVVALTSEGSAFQQVGIPANPALLGLAVPIQAVQVTPEAVGFSNPAALPIDH